DDPEAFKATAHNYWLSNWKYLATDESQTVADISADAKGLALPKAVIDKIFYSNARRVFLSAKK
ncbi:MAG: hypothetical protein B7Z12_21315, partial [Caulobacter vibrioides]